MGLVIKTGNIDWKKFIYEGKEENGVRFKPISGEKVMVGVFEVAPDWLGHSFHRHEDEQIGFVLQGRRQFFWIDEDGEKSEILEKGSLYIMRSNELHCSKPLGGETFIILEIWSPPPPRYKEIALKASKKE